MPVDSLRKCKARKLGIPARTPCDKFLTPPVCRSRTPNRSKPENTPIGKEEIRFPYTLSVSKLSRPRKMSRGTALMLLPCNRNVLAFVSPSNAPLWIVVREGLLTSKVSKLPKPAKVSDLRSTKSRPVISNAVNDVRPAKSPDWSTGGEMLRGPSIEPSSYSVISAQVASAREFWTSATTASATSSVRSHIPVVWATTFSARGLVTPDPKPMISNNTVINPK